MSPAICRVRVLFRPLGEVEEPCKVVEDDEDAGSDELERGERDERPGLGEVLEVDKVAEDAEGDEMEWQSVEEVEETV